MTGWTSGDRESTGDRESSGDRGRVGRVPIGRLILLQRRLLSRIWPWLRGRGRSTPPGEQHFGYDRAQAPTTYAIIGVVVIEGGVLHLLLPWPAVRVAALVLHLYVLALFVASLAAAKVRPHVVDGQSLRVRHGGSFELRIPWHLVEDARVSLRNSGGEMLDLADGRLDVVVGGQTNVTINLAEPIPVATPMGRTGAVSRVHLFADDPRALTEAMEGRPREGPP